MGICSLSYLPLHRIDCDRGSYLRSPVIGCNNAGQLGRGGTQPKWNSNFCNHLNLRAGTQLPDKSSDRLSGGRALLNLILPQYAEKVN